MPDTLYTMQHDTAPVFAGQLLDDEGAIIPLDGADHLYLIWRPVGASSGETRVECTIVDPSPDLGSDPDAVQWSYQRVEGDTDVVGSFDVEHEIVYSDGTIQTVPNRADYRATMVVGDDLDTVQP